MPLRRHSARRYTLDDYFAVEEASGVRNEFLDGDIFAMAGGSLTHNRIASNVHFALRTRLGDRCDILPGDQRIAAPSGLYTYADVVVICGEPTLMPGRHDTVTNPSAVIEVLSPSTRDYDENQKLDHYRSIPSLQAVVLVEQEAAEVRVWKRTSDGWTVEEAAGIDASAQVLGVELPLAEVYARALP